MGFFLNDLGRPARRSRECICPVLSSQQLYEGIDQKSLAGARMPFKKENIVTIAVEKVSKMDNNLSLTGRQIEILEKVEQILCCCQTVTGKKIRIQIFSGRCPSKLIKGASKKDGLARKLTQLYRQS